jgi:hypothetical protein
MRDAVVTIHFGLGQDAPVRTDDDGYFVAAWSHGNWFESVVAAASAPGYATIRSRIGDGGWTCEFRLTKDAPGPEPDIDEACKSDG